MDKQTETVNDIQTLLKFTFGLIAIIAGADKFTNLLTDWNHYLSPTIASFLPVSVSVFMKIVGIIEIVAGIVVFVRTKMGGYIVCTWLVLISLNLVLHGDLLDVAVRDMAMAIGAFSLARLSIISNTTFSK